MNQDSNPEEGKKSEKTYVNKQQSSDNNCLDLVTLDNTRKELISIEKKCERNRIKYDYLCGENIKQLVEDYSNGLHGESYGKNHTYESKLSGTIKIYPEAMKPSPPIPKTSSAIVGWRSSLDKYNLEIFGPLYISPRNTIISLTPGEIPSQRFIHLG